MHEKFKYRLFNKSNLTSLSNFINLGSIQGSNALIQILLIPIITRLIGLSELGHVMVANSYATLIALFINYGSNQSGVKDVALYRSDTKVLSGIFYTIYLTRGILFALSFCVVLVLYFLDLFYAPYFLLAQVIVLAEAFNPFFFFVGLQKLLLYNVLNLAARLLSAAGILLFIRSSSESIWVNFYLGMGSLLAYVFLFFYIIRKYQLATGHVSFAGFRKYLTQNFYLMGNNLSVQLQQSIFLFTLSTTGNPLILGAYSLCDKIVWSFRLLIISFSNAIYPRAVVAFQTRKEDWRYYKKRINLALFAVFMLTGVGILLFAPWLTLIITGEHNQLATLYIKCIAFVPLIAALNSLNVIDLLMKNQYHHIFIIALILLCITLLSSAIFIQAKNPAIFGYYPITVEIFSLPLYWYFIAKTRKTPVTKQMQEFL